MAFCKSAIENRGAIFKDRADITNVYGFEIFKR